MHLCSEKGIERSLQRCRPREGCGLHPNPCDIVNKYMNVAVPARGAGCIYKLMSFLRNEVLVAVPARGAGCINYWT